MRPLSFGESLDVAIKIVTRNALTLIKLVAVIIVPVQVLSSLIFASTLPDAGAFGSSPFEPQVTPAAIPSTEDILRYFAGTILVFVLTFVGTALATAASYKAVGDAYLGSSPSWQESLRFGLRRLHSVAWVTFLTFVAVVGITLIAAVGLAVPFLAAGEAGAALGFALFGVLGVIPLVVWLYNSWSVAVPALLTEGQRGTRALGRSFRLVKGRWWAVFGVLIVSNLAAGLVGAMVGFVPQLALLATGFGDSVLASFLISGAFQALASVVTTPFLAAVVVVLYFDLRVRKEGFDLQLLAERIGSAPPAGVPSHLLPPPPAPGPVHYPSPPAGLYGHPAPYPGVPYPPAYPPPPYPAPPGYPPGPYVPPPMPPPPPPPPGDPPDTPAPPEGEEGGRGPGKP